MALRFSSKIHRQISKNVYKSLSSKRGGEIDANQEAVKTREKSPSPPTQSKPSHSIQYQVCRPRTSPIIPFSRNRHNETEAARKAVALQHLQPSMLPEFYKPPIEINSACMLDPMPEVSVVSQRKFEDAKAYRNMLPLRVPKLANPFPAPAKVMQSHTISDQERARKMFAEAKMLKASANAKTQRQPSVGSLPPVRGYATKEGGTTSNDPKCKIIQSGDQKKTCPNWKLGDCKPIKTIRCARRKAVRIPCTKRVAPYPSYSETCHEDPINKPSECKICPYKEEEHPSYKPQKRRIHTCSALFAKSKMDKDGKKPKPCGDPHTKFQKQSRYSFCPTKAQEAEEQKEAQEAQVNYELSNTDQTSTVSLGIDMKTWLDNLRSGNDVIISADKGGARGGGCKKFPFQQCNIEIVKERKARKSNYDGKCPPKQKPKLVQDCPREEDNCKRKISSLHDMLLMADETDETGKRKKKCPKLNLGLCIEKEVVKDDDPCNRKRRGTTKICPDDLLNPRPKKKKTCPVLPPVAQIAKGTHVRNSI